MNCGPQCFLNLNWDQSLALSSMVLSPASDPPPAVESLAVHDFAREISAGPQFMAMALKPNLAMMGHPRYLQIDQGGLPMLENVMPPNHLEEFPTDPGFAERAASLSCFDGRNCTGFASQIALPECGKLLRVSRSLSLGAKRPNVGFSDGSQATQLLDGLHSGPKEAELLIARDDSSVSDPASGGCRRKRKAAPKGKGKETSSTNSANDPNKASAREPNSKRCRGRTQNDPVKPKTEQNGSMSSTENGNKKHGEEPPKDYIHVRARRGEATDSHSLAERVRRDKISRRLKLLQELVPGCNKVVGKAMMLDEIINYVQSLQRQVEFLSMKLAAVNPQLMNFSTPPNILSKDMHQTCGLLLNPAFPVEAPPGSALSYAGQPKHGNHPLNLAVTNGMETQHPFLNGINDAASQLGHFWQEDLQSVVPMDIGFNGPMQPDQMKMDL